MMGAIYHKQYTKAVPRGAEIITLSGEPLAKWIRRNGNKKLKRALDKAQAQGKELAARRFAQWKDRSGKLRVELLVEGREDRISTMTKTYVAGYRDGSGQVREVATGCCDSTAASNKLATLKKRAENVKSGITTASEDAAIEHQKTPLDEHFTAYQAVQTAKGNDSVRIKNDKSRFERLCDDCGWHQLSDLSGDSLSTWLANRTKDRMSAGNRNEFRQTMTGFANWCVRTSRLLTNPFVNVPKADAKADQRRKRRALTEAELEKLLAFAQLRPLEEALTIRRGKDKGKLLAKVRDDVRDQLLRLGFERALIYKTLVLTGLRKSELASLTVGALHLDGENPYADLAPEDEKNREGSDIALPLDLAADLKQWVAMLAQAREDCIPLSGEPQQLPANTPLFSVPAGLLRILNRDLRAAGIPKRDERGWTVDVHAIRHSFGTLLSKKGVTPRVAQAAMRHSTIDLTMNTYTDPKLLDVHAALKALPSFPLNAPTVETQRSTGTEGFLAANLAVNPHANQQFLARACKLAVEAIETLDVANADVTVDRAKKNSPPAIACNGLHQVDRKGVEPSTSALRTQRSPN
jgi:integrase